MGKMKISFPQSLFDSPPTENISSGKSKASNSSILFCGIARNVGKTLQNNIDRINYLGKYFKQYGIFIYENDSTDNTLDILKSNKLTYLSDHRQDCDYRSLIIDGKDSNQLNRCKVLASCRNNYLIYARENCKFYSYVCILDWDICGWSFKGFFDSIHRISQPEIASVSSYGVLSDYHNSKELENSANLLMYDSFAFRPLGFTGPLTNDIQHRFNFVKCSSPTIVRSNFGGLCIYKTPVLLDQYYEAKSVDGFVDCDHVCINDRISKYGFSHLLNNYMVVSYSKHKHYFV
jgi:hypothetical protein